MNNNLQNKKTQLPGKNRRLNAKDSETQIRRKKMGTFLQSLREVHPMIESAKRMALTHGDFRIQLARLFHQQKSVVSVLADSWSISPDDLADAIVFAKLSRASSNILSLGHNDSEVDLTRVNDIANFLSVMNGERRELGELIQDNTVSSDILVNVKIVLLSGAIRLQKILTGLGVDYDTSVEHLRWFHQASVVLGKDIAFNWDKDSQFKDREVLFQEVIGFCADMVIDSWLDAASKSIQLNEDAMKYQNRSRSWQKTRASITELSMGYEKYKEMSLEQAISSVEQILERKLSSYNLSLVPDDKRSIFEIGLVSAIDALAAKAWSDAAAKIIANLKSLSKEELQEWRKSDDGQRPMPIEKFTIELDLLLSAEKNLIKLSKQQNIDAEKISKQKLSVLWGLSDAVCRVKTSKSN